MNCCSSGCGADAPVEAPQVMDAAHQLAVLLLESPALQAYQRAARAVRADPEVAELVRQMQEQPYLYDPRAGRAADEARRLEDCLEAQPVVVAFRRAEQAARALFQAVDGAVSAVSGAPFAELAQPSGHG